MVAVLGDHGYDVRVVARGETFARLVVKASVDTEGEADKVELSADWRAHPPVLLEVGPVLHIDDAVANKMCALYGRALPRDFLDVDAAITSGRFTQEWLLDLSKSADDGFDLGMFANVLGALTQITDAAFAEYQVSQGSIDSMRRRFARWRQDLLNQ